MSARADVLFTGYARRDGVAGTIGLIRDGDHTIVVDPGMVPARAVIFDALDSLGVRPDDVTDIVISHHHPDHTLNIALFPVVPVHDFWAVYHGDQWLDRPADGAVVSPHVRLMATPGHTPEDITTLVDTTDGVVAFTHCWWYEGIEGDRRAADLDELMVRRARVAEVADLVVPGHGPAFEISR
ncbi:MAG TPA: MBL fold metallo-hydrolase [Acidimicrobiia bacterium]|nr:MBL fold metallo-hydrolase [Acidimicrobiia bacterium]